MVKPGATLIDVGINRVTDPADVERFFAGDAERAATFAKRGSVIVGDIHPAAFARCRGLHAGPRRRGRADDRDADAQHREGGEAASRNLHGETITAMLRVGLTGGLGSGKSTAARLFAAHGAYVLQSDEIGRELMQPGQAGLLRPSSTTSAKMSCFPTDASTARTLAKIAFADGRVEELNAIVHPAVIARQAELSEAIFAQDPKAVVIVESALIFETNYGGTHGRRGQTLGLDRFDCIILVTAPEDVKIARFIARCAAGEEMTPERRAELEAEARRRLAQQIPDEQKSGLCDYVLTNGGRIEGAGGAGRSALAHPEGSGQ